MDLPFQDDQVASTIRRALAADPVAFAVLYLSHHLKDKDGRITWSEAHFEWARMAESWKQPTAEPMENRSAIIAPRECGKTTWWFLILPLWAAVNGHSKFAVAFANATSQAEAHLATFKKELDTNPLLNLDYQMVCEPMRRKTGTTLADRAGMIHQRSGFVFAAKGMDSGFLGMKVGEIRPDLIILDDVEPDEANYSRLLAEKRLGTITDSVFPLNIYARVIFVGTVTMPSSIMHQLVKAAQGRETEDWIKDNKIKPKHFRPLVVQDDGSEISIWPQKWPTAWLQSQRHTRSYAKNYDNDPMAREGVYWLKEDFQYGRPTVESAAGPVHRRFTRTALFVDPAVTSRKTSDFTGLAVVSFMPEMRERPDRLHPKGRVVAESGVVIRESLGVRLSGQHLKARAIQLMDVYPEIRAVVVETNQGGDLWLDVFAGIPNLKVITTFSTQPKEVRFATGLEFWQRKRVYHDRPFATLEEQAVGFPRVEYDDVIDAGNAGVLYFLDPPKKVRAGASSSPYVRST